VERTNQRASRFQRLNGRGSTCTPMTLPRPVATPQPKRHALFRGMRGLIFAAEISAMTVYSENVEQPVEQCRKSQALDAGKGLVGVLGI